MKYHVISKCRVCGSSHLRFILDLGYHPLANALLKDKNETEEKFPLTLLFCSDCSLVQIKETVKKEILFKKYLWVTGTSSTAKQFAATFYNKVIAVTNAKKGDLILEIASNDGTFLEPFIRNEYNVIGVDPANNIVEIANKKGMKTINLFWSKRTANKIIKEYGNPNIIIARNVIPHVDELHDVMSGIGLSLTEDGVGVIEFHYAGNIMEQLQYDSIYHEHLCYFSIKAIENMLNQFGLFPFHIDLSPISGGAYIIYFSKKKRKCSADYHRLSKKEIDLKISEFKTWKMFADRCIEHKKKSIKIVDSFGNNNICGFGASARSSTYLNYCGFSNLNIAAIIDNNTLKQKLYTTGSKIPIVSIEEGIDIKPELIFILAWNFREEIIKECEKKGYQGKYLIPFPERPYVFNE